MTEHFYAGIDAGGTGFKCIIGVGPDRILAEYTVDVTNPQNTLETCAEFFSNGFSEFGRAKAFGLASFGPVDLNKSSPSYGYITNTPKPGWQNTDIVGFFTKTLKLPIAFDTDVNGALLAEQRWGAAQGQGLHSAVYVTVGTGIGAGIMVDGRLIHGAMHSEAGHMLLSKRSDDVFDGVCPFHGGCLEGLASGPAMAKRWQTHAESLPNDHPAWDLEAHYLAAMCVNLALSFSPQRIILGGGVMQASILIGKVREKYRQLMNNYLGEPVGGIDQFIQLAALGPKAGALGALALAQTL